MSLDNERFLAFTATLHRLLAGRRTIIFSMLTGLGLSVAIAFLIPPKYTAKAAFIPPNSLAESSASLLLGQLSQVSGMGATGLLGGAKSPSELYVGILKSRTIADQIIREFDLKSVYHVTKDSLAEKQLAKRSEFDVDPKDSVVSLSVEDSDPKRARDIANAYLNALHDINGRLALSEASQRRLFFEQQLSAESNALADAEVALKRVQEKSGFIAPERQTATEIAAIAQTRAEISARKVQLAALSQSATPQNAGIITLESEIEDLQNQLNRLLEGSSQNPGGLIPTDKVPELSLEYERNLREVKYHEALFEILTKQYETAKMDEAREAPLLQILDYPTIPDSKSSPWRSLIVAVGFILGFLGGSCWVLLEPSIHLIYTAVLRTL